MDTFKGKEEIIAKQVQAYLDGQITRPKEIFKSWTGEPFAKNDKCFLQGNRESFDVGQYVGHPDKAGMSMIHILAIPVEPIWNGVELTKENVGIIDDMFALFKESWENKEIRYKIVAHQLTAIKTRFVKSEDENKDVQYKEAVKHYEELKAMIEDLKSDDFGLGLHLAPDNSINVLHMHIIAIPKQFRKYSTGAHDEKTKNALEVRDYIKNMPESG